MSIFLSLFDATRSPVAIYGTLDSRRPHARLVHLCDQACCFCAFGYSSRG